MRQSPKFIAPMLAASLLLAACGGGSSYGGNGSSSSTPAGSSKTARVSNNAGSSGDLVKTAANSTLGATVLVDTRGMTLYHLSAEGAGKFICTASSCLSVWHPLTVAAGNTPRGSVGSLGTVKRPDGTEQVTYKGMPLYTFAQDQQPGDATGQGIKDVGTWSAVAAGASTAAKPAGTAAPSSSPSSGQYGY